MFISGLMAKIIHINDWVNTQDWIGYDMAGSTWSYLHDDTKTKWRTKNHTTATINLQDLGCPQQLGWCIKSPWMSRSVTSKETGFVNHEESLQILNVMGEECLHLCHF